SGAASAVNFVLTNNPGAVATLTIVSGTPQATGSDTGRGSALAVLAKDSFGNVVPGASVTFTAPSSGASASLSGSNTQTVTTDATGTATSAVPVANTSAGSYNVVTTSGAAGAVNFVLTNNPGAVATLTIVSGTPQ